MIDQKIFVIGFNKTATSTFHILFEKHGLKSQHDGSHWNVDDYQCFSDNGNLRDWKKLYLDYPNSMFVLNTRPVDEWIRSRAKHCYVERLRWGYPPRVNLYKRWIMERNVFFLEVIRFFERDPEVLTIVDISQAGWLEFVTGRLGLTPYDLKINTGSELVPESHLEEIDSRMQESMDELSIGENDRSAPFIVKSLVSGYENLEASKLLGLYANNLL